MIRLASLLAILVAAAPGPVRGADPVPAADDRTLKERLSDKASDEQRVDNCKVPPERRGPKPRPAGCGPVPPSAPAQDGRR